MKTFAFLWLTVISLHLYASEAAAPKELYDLIRTTQQLRDVAEQELASEKISAEAEGLYNRQQAQFRQLKALPRLKKEMATLERYSKALHAIRTDLDEYTLFRAYATLVHRMIEDIKIFYPAQASRVALMQMDEELSQIQTLVHHHDNMAFDRSEYESILSDCIVRIETLQWKLRKNTSEKEGDSLKEIGVYLSALESNSEKDRLASVNGITPLRHDLAHLAFH